MLFRSAEGIPGRTHSAGARRARAAPGAGGTAFPGLARAPAPAPASKPEAYSGAAQHTPPNAHRLQGSGTPSRPPRAHQRGACGAKLATRRAAVTPPRLQARRRRPSSGTHVPLVPLWKAGRLSAPPGLASVPAPLPSAAEVGLPEDKEHRAEHGRRATQRQHQGAQRPRRHRGGRGARVPLAQAEPAGLPKMAPPRLPRPRPPTQPTQPALQAPQCTAAVATGGGSRGRGQGRGVLPPTPLGAGWGERLCLGWTRPYLLLGG